MMRYRKVLGVSLFAFTSIVFTGALVRLSDSGLGCEDWPQCSSDELIPAWSFHAWIEFGNRLYSGLIGFVAIGLVWATHRLGPEWKTLRPLAWSVLAGTIAQVLVGAVTVKTDLNPFPVTVHFLLSMVLIWLLLIMWARVQPPVGAEDAPVSLRKTSVGIGIWATLVLTTGTLVTGTGPNGGDSRADRLDFDVQTIARVHSTTVWVLLAGFLAFAVVAHRTMPSDDPRLSRLRIVLALIIAQGGIGYWQYATGVPPALVLTHVVGSVMVWCGVVWIGLAFNRSPWIRYDRNG
jgi:cytochrome c oxidase assembly protein subunit 15